MKTNRVIGAVAVILSAAGPALADSETTMLWSFSTSDNPASVTPSVATNPFGGTGTAEVTPYAGTGYSSGVFFSDPTDYGTRTGLWDIGGAGGGVQLGINRWFQPAPATTTLSYTVTLDTFVTTGNVFPPYSASVVFSSPNGTLGQPTMQQTTLQVTASGAWVERVYGWSGLSPSGLLSLSISPASASTGLLLDGVQWEITGGPLVAIPEPTVVQLAAVGSVILGFGAWRRRQSKA